MAGGALIGLVAGLLWLVHGRIAGIAGIARVALRGPDRDWRLAFIAGLVAAGMVARITVGPAVVAGLDTIPLLRLAIAGLLVGIGTSMANGCTSGHGICGLARLSRRSLVAVPVFMGTAMITLALFKVLA
ncbi:YeeE/YedE family protein [Novosphingobium sp. FSW06-99]|uniref:YeeE/YedE family protein n=1 Tax=Novosphingobium sp. FSW06-99 TaxID=1739113 RepID=UPI00351217D8